MVGHGRCRGARWAFVLRFIMVTSVIFSFFYVARICLSKPQSMRLEAETAATPRPAIKDTPYVYSDVVDLRVIIMTYNRPASLARCLAHVQRLVLDGDVGVVHIWVDRSRDGTVHQATLSTARAFTWPHGATTVHVWPSHVGIYGQWIDTWRPPAGDRTREVALLLEDDIDVSPHAYRWLRHARAFYRARSDVGSVSLSEENVPVTAGPDIRRQLRKPRRHPAFLYPVFGSWGMAPEPRSWRRFQDWYHQIRRSDANYKPYTPEAALITRWYKAYEKAGRQDNMWSMWYVHFCHLHHLFTVHPNLAALNATSLARHRRARGLHYRGKVEQPTDKYLLQEWKPEFVMFPERTFKYHYNGTLFQQ